MSDRVSDLDHHAHVCPECAHIWWHKRSEIGPADGREAHTCPKCKKGTDYWAKASQRDAMEERRRITAKTRCHAAQEEIEKGEPDRRRYRRLVNNLIGLMRERGSKGWRRHVRRGLADGSITRA